MKNRKTKVKEEKLYIINNDGVATVTVDLKSLKDKKKRF